MTKHNITWAGLRQFFEVDSFGLPLPADYAAAFDDFKATELAETWEYGYLAAMDDSHRPIDAPPTPNPHRKDGL